MVVCYQCNDIFNILSSNFSYQCDIIIVYRSWYRDKDVVQEVDA